MRRRVAAALLLGLAWGGQRELAGQDALVLSTGGSRGFVHVGALMALEERGYDPGVVVGNSMGAVTSGGAPADVRLALGDDGGLPGHRWGVERGRARLLAGADLAWPLPLDGFVRLRARVGAAPLALDDLAETGAWAAGAALEGFWPTPLGPVVIGFGVNGRGEHRVDVGLGSPM